MDESKKRLTFLGIVGILVLVIVVSVVYLNQSGPAGNTKSGGTSVVDDKKNESGMITIKDINDGEMQIPKYNVAESSYDIDKITEEQGIISYDGVKRIGITVTEKNGDIDWQKVKDSGVDFVYVRIGYRGVTDGKVYRDSSCGDKIMGADEAGLGVGVYFYSHATTEDEAAEEADEVLNKIRGYQIKYPIVFDWEFTPESRLSGDTQPRTQDVTPDRVTRFADAFCEKIRKSGYKTMISMDKQMGYDYYDLEKLKDNAILYVEYKKQPAFHYNFAMWQYSSEGSVPGIEGNVKMTYSFEDYS